MPLISIGRHRQRLLLGRLRGYDERLPAGADLGGEQPLLPGHRVRPGDYVSPRVFQVRALVFSLLFLSEHVDLRAWSLRTVAFSHCKGLNASVAEPEAQPTSRDLLGLSRLLRISCVEEPPKRRLETLNKASNERMTTRQSRHPLESAMRTCGSREPIRVGNIENGTAWWLNGSALGAGRQRTTCRERNNGGNTSELT